MKTEIREELELGEGVTATLDGAVLQVKGPKGEVSRNFLHPKVKVLIESGKVVLDAGIATKREKKLIMSFISHAKNMIKGVQEHFVYTLKICSGHFPMNVSVSGNDFVVKNFLGEAVPRKVGILTGVDVKVNGTEVVVSSPNKESAGQTAARIEQLCRITNRDRRIFQDGIYIINKAGKSIA